jgi:hypothetical protein
MYGAHSYGALLLKGAQLSELIFFIEIMVGYSRLR